LSLIQIGKQDKIDHTTDRKYKSLDGARLWRFIFNNQNLLIIPFDSPQVYTKRTFSLAPLSFLRTHKHNFCPRS